MKVKIINKSNNEIPTYATKGSAGIDLRAYIEKSITLNHMEYKMIPTGIYIELPSDTFGMITPRSGLAAKYGISIVNSPGIIDESYRGELKIIMMNQGKEPFEIFNGDRIAQMLLMKYENIEFEIAEELSETERGTGGFNSTGIK